MGSSEQRNSSGLKGYYALVDCNNFYVSCERVFNPGLMDRPVVALSNNDGCIIARSNEAKALGIRMGEPFFKARSFLERHNVKVFSSNYALYGDMSRRVFETVSSIIPDMEIYSIDEAFIRLYMREDALHGLAVCIRETVLKHTGIPVSVGISSTRTLAKLAALQAKKGAGVCCMTDSMRNDVILAETGVEDIWGVGGKTAAELGRMGISNALQLKRRKPAEIRKRFNLMVARTVCELQGISSVTLHDVRDERKRIRVSRSFGKRINDLQTLREAVAFFVERAAEKLRHQRFAAGALLVFIRTSPYLPPEERYQQSITLVLPRHSSDTGILIGHAERGLETIFRRGYQYQKAGVMLLDLLPAGRVGQGMFDTAYRANELKRAKLMKTIDSINASMGRGTLRYASSGMKCSWQMRAEFRSPAFTTDWNQLVCVK